MIRSLALTFLFVINAYAVEMDQAKARGQYQKLTKCLKNLENAEKCLDPLFDPKMSSWKKKRYFGLFMHYPDLVLVSECKQVGAICFKAKKGSLVREGYIKFNRDYQIFRVKM